MSYAVNVTTTPATRTEQVYDILRAELLNGGLHPGQKLKMVELTERFGVDTEAAQQIAFGAGGNVRAALLDAEAHLDVIAYRALKAA